MTLAWIQNHVELITWNWYRHWAVF